MTLRLASDAPLAGSRSMLDPRGRLIALAAWAVATAATRSLPGALVGLSGAALAVGLAGPSPGWLLRRLLAVVPFFLLYAATTVAVGGRSAVPGILLVSVKMIALALIAAAIGAGRPGELWFTLAGLRCPGKLVWLGLLGERFARLVAAELVRVRQAWTVRGFRPGATYRKRCVIGSSIAGLTRRSLQRGDRVAAAMVARGFDGRFPPPAADPRPLDAIAIAVAGIGAAATLAAWDGWRA